MGHIHAFIASLPRRPAAIPPLQLYWALFMGGLFSFLLGNALGASAGPFTHVLGLASAGTCGLGWLLARALFRPDGNAAAWPRMVVASLFATVLLSDLLSGLGGGAAGQIDRVLGNVHALASSTVLLMCLVEAFDGWGPALARDERRFRLAFAAGYGALAFVSVIMLRQADANALGPASDVMIKSICAVLAAAGATWAAAHRNAHPAASLNGASNQARKRRAPSEADLALGEKLKRLLAREDVQARAELKVADLARLAGEPDYKVTQCITGVLGFQNFNRLINHYRIARAQQILADPGHGDLPILTIALDCGFGSIGPFNRAFKEATGSTPSAYREARAKAG